MNKALYIKKQWFIKSNPVNIDQVYEVDSKKVFSFIIIMK